MKKRAPRIILAILVVCLASWITWITYPLWMPLLYRYLDMGQRPLSVDLIIITGGSENRAAKGAQLYNALYAPKILISGGSEDIERSHHILTKNGVPEKDITAIRGATSTWDEAVYNLQYMRERNIRSVLIVTDTPHTRRLRAVYASLNVDKVDIIVVAAPLGDASTWWKDNEIRDFVFREYVKMLYYFLRYDVWSWS